MPQNSSSRSRKPGSTPGKAAAGKAAAGKVGGEPRKAPTGGATSSTRAAKSGRAADPSRSTRPSGAAKTAARPPARKPPGRPPGNRRSIVNRRQRPWGLIITSIIVVLFAGAVITVAVTRNNGPKSNAADAAYTRNEIAAASAISGVIYKKEPNHQHVTSSVKYDSSPPVGGNHSQYWADCTGTVYPAQIADENAVHALEHGAVWITYNPSLSAADVAVLAKKVTGVDRMFMTPYAGLKTPISLQSWGYQLFVNNVTDARIDAFIKALKFNPGTTPEPLASCSDPPFKAKPSTVGKPTF